MSKKRRTRKDKMTALTRRPTINVSYEQSEPNISLENTPKIAGIKTPTTHKNYSYVLSETKSTLFITSVIIGLNLILFLILKLKFISLFGISF